MDSPLKEPQKKQSADTWTSTRIADPFTLKQPAEENEPPLRIEPSDKHGTRRDTIV